MSKLAHSNQETMDRIERRAAWQEGNLDLWYTEQRRLGLDPIENAAAESRRARAAKWRQVRNTAALYGFVIGHASGFLVGQHKEAIQAFFAGLFG